MNNLLPKSTPITFAVNSLNRAAEQRRKTDWLKAQQIGMNARFLPLDQLRALICLKPAPKIDWRSGDEMEAAFKSGAQLILLGTDDAGVAHFAVDVTGLDIRREDWGKWIDVRSIAGSLAPEETGILAQARSMIDWHARHRFCAVCGHQSHSEQAGYARRCGNDACKAEHFPRTDPVVIMLILQGERCLLGRQPRFPAGNFSALAGFIEPGESIEDAVRREVREEVGVIAGAVRYIASQPWPFPSSLMIGCFAEALSDEIHMDRDELDDARWFSRDEVIEMAKRAGTDVAPRLPPPLSLAYQLAKAWIDGR